MRLFLSSIVFFYIYPLKGKIGLMLKKRIPYALANTLYEIPSSFYLAKGIKTIFLDLDNTLAPYHCSLPDDRAKRWAHEAKDNGITVYILSNNTGKRVGLFAKELGIECASLMRKPFSGPLKRFLRTKELDPNECIMVGDQIMTDVTACNGAHVRCILTEPLDGNEPPWTRFNRLFDRPKRKKIKKLGLAKPWEELL